VLVENGHLREVVGTAEHGTIVACVPADQESRSTLVAACTSTV
jgi:hypothetical protein